MPWPMLMHMKGQTEKKSRMLIKTSKLQRTSKTKRRPTSACLRLSILIAMVWPLLGTVQELHGKLVLSKVLLMY